MGKDSPRKKERTKAVNDFDEEKIDSAVENMKELKERFEKRDKQTQDALKVDARTLQIQINK